MEESLATVNHDRPAWWMRQPAVGVLFVALSIVVTLAGSVVLALASDDFDAAFTAFVNGLGLAWFIWGVALTAWGLDLPLFVRLRQPYRGLALLPVGIALGCLTWWASMAALGNDMEKAGSFIMYSAFFMFSLAWFYDSWPLAKVRQPLRIVGLMAISFLGGTAVFLALGPRPDCWLYVVPMWLIPAFDMWPLAGRGTAWMRGTIWVVCILLLTVVTELILNAVGLPLSSDKGAEYAGLIFGGMLFLYCFEGWPFARVRQPRRGVYVVAVTLAIGGVVMPAVFWSVLGLPYGYAAGFIFCMWYVLVYAQWLTAPPVRADGERTDLSQAASQRS
jgi:hypothetical protein